MRLSYKILSLASVACILPASANAAGFFIQEQSVRGLGAAFAGVSALPKDASTIFYNPAGMTRLTPGTHFTTGIHGIFASSELTDTGSTVDPAGAFPSGPIGGSNDDPFDPILVPNLYAAHSLSDDLWIGLGISSPFGLGNEYNNDDFFGRFNSTESSLLTIDIAPSVAYQINDRVSLGGSVNIQYAKADLESAIPDPTGPGNVAAEGFQELEGQDWSASYTIGALIEATDKLDIGLNYRHNVSHTLDGHLLVDLPDNIAGGIIVNNLGTANLNLPSIASIGAAYEYDDKLTLLGQVNHFGWASFDDITVRFDAPNPLDGSTSATVQQDYKNTFSIALGAEYEYDDKWTFRGGVQYDETPTGSERSTLIADADRYWIAGGASYQWSDNLSLDFGATYINVADESIDLSETEAGGSLVNTRADIDADIAIVSFGLNYRF